MASLAKNTIYLYILTISNYLFGLATIPYLTRILGPEQFGNLGFAMAFGGYFNIIIDFGFILSATKKVALNANNKIELSKIFLGVSAAKILIFLFLLLCLLISSHWIREINDNLILLILFLVLGLFTSLLPDYIYRGLENMKIIAVRGVIIRAIFVLLIFIFLKKPTQIYLVPIFQTIGAIIVITWMIWDLKKNIGLINIPVKLSYIFYLIKDSFEYFISRIASSIYNVTNTLILGFIFPGRSIVGFYSSADRIRGLAGQACSPLADSFYPYMLKTKNYSKLIKTILVFQIPILIGLTILYIWAKPICIIVFGAEYGETYLILRWMLPIMAITLPQYMLGFPALTPIGKAKWANISVEIATINQLIGLTILLFLNNITAIHLCILTLISECLCLLVRISVLLKNKKLIKSYSWQR